MAQDNNPCCPEGRRRRSARFPCRRWSAASSGAVCSRATLTVSMMAPTGSARLSAISASDMMEFLGHAVHEVAALDLHGTPDPVLRRTGRADRFLDALRAAALANQKIMVAADIGDDRFVHLVAADPHAARIDDAAQAENRHLGGAAADVDDQRPGGLGDRQAGPDRRKPLAPRSGRPCGRRRFRPTPEWPAARREWSPTARR